MSETKKRSLIRISALFVLVAATLLVPYRSSGKGLDWRDRFRNIQCAIMTLGAGNCAAQSSGGTVTSVAVSSPLSASPSPITSTGTISCPTCVTSAASLTSGQIMTGSGGQASATDSNLDDGVTTPNTLTYGGSGGISATIYTSFGTVHGIVFPSSGTQASVSSGNVGYGSDTGGSGYCEVNENGGGWVRCDTASNTLTLSNKTFVAPVLGAATGTSLIVTGQLDGTAGVNETTTTACTLGTSASNCGSMNFSSGYTLNQEGTAGTGVTYTLPATVVGKQYCVANSGTASVVNTGVLTVYPPASSYVILNGVVNIVGGGGTHGVASGGAAGDAACFVAIDATHWQVWVGKGTWTEN